MNGDRMTRQDVDSSTPGAWIRVRWRLIRLSGPTRFTALAFVAQRELRRIRRYDRGRGGGGAIQKDGGDGEGGAGEELAVGAVGGEAAKAGAAGDGKVDGHRDGVIQQRAVDARRDTKNPGGGAGIGIPGTGAAAQQLQARD